MGAQVTLVSSALQLQRHPSISTGMSNSLHDAHATSGQSS
jgi:hypothetical protein